MRTDRRWNYSRRSAPLRPCNSASCVCFRVLGRFLGATALSSWFLVLGSLSFRFDLPASPAPVTQILRVSSLLRLFRSVVLFLFFFLCEKLVGSCASSNSSGNSSCSNSSSVVSIFCIVVLRSSDGKQ